jgi:membrane dipeptidase
MPAPLPVFDGHNDFLYRLHAAPERREAIWLRGEGAQQMDLPRMRQGQFAGGFFAVYVPSPQDFDAAAVLEAMDNPPYDLPLPALIDEAAARPVAMAMAGHLLWMERAAPGAFRLCRSAAEIRACMDQGVIAGLMHFEGAEAIGPDLDSLHLYHAMGLRSVGPVWSRPTIFGAGVPFRFPGHPDTGPGLTALGEDLVRACNRLGIVVDLSHMTEKGFWDVARISQAPLVATHSNAHALTASTRNLTDRQLHAIRDSGGMVGLNFATCFLRPDGRESPDIGWEPVLAHLDHLIAEAGEDHVGFGSDLDGATLPRGIGDVAGLPALQQALRAHGYDEALMVKLCHANWLSLLERTLGG